MSDVAVPVLPVPQAEAGHEPTKQCDGSDTYECTDCDARECDCRAGAHDCCQRHRERLCPHGGCPMCEADLELPCLECVGSPAAAVTP